MAQRLSHTAKKKIEEIGKALDRITANAGRLDEALVEELFRRASINSQPDGFPVTAVADRTSGSKSSDDGIGRPTEALALRNIKGKKIQDPIKKLADRVLELVREADFALEDVLGALERNKFEVEDARQRPTTIPCLVCELPAQKAGFCMPHYHDWWDHGKPDRQAWISWKTQAVNSDKPHPQILVENCPAPSSGNKARRGPWVA